MKPAEGIFFTSFFFFIENRFFAHTIDPDYSFPSHHPSHLLPTSSPILIHFLSVSHLKKNRLLRDKEKKKNKYKMKQKPHIAVGQGKQKGKSPQEQAQEPQTPCSHHQVLHKDTKVEVVIYARGPRAAPNRLLLKSLCA